MASLSAPYIGSRSMREGIIWLLLVNFAEVIPEFASVFVDRIGVDNPIAGRLKAAGSMSGIVYVRDQRCRCKKLDSNAQYRRSFMGPVKQ